MAKIVVAKETAVPATPPAGYVRMFPQGSSIRYVDEDGSVYTLATGVSAEEVQDIVGALVIDSSSLQWTYDDPLNSLSAAVLPAGVNHDALLNFVANKHIDHSAVSISAGTGLSGGGDLTASRTISMPSVGTAGTYGTAAVVPVLTTDAQGRVSSVANTAITGVPAANITNTPAGTITAANVQGALNQLDSLKIAATEKGAANGVCPLDATSKISSTYLPSYVDDVVEYANLAAFPVTGETSKIYVALDTNRTYRWSGSAYVEISPSLVTSVFGRANAVTAQNGDYTASQVTNAPAGSIVSTTVQAAINELDTNKQPKDATLTALASFNTNGILVQTAADTFAGRSLAAGTGIAISNADGVAGNPSISTTITQYTDELAQDAVGGILTDTASIDFTYNDAGNQISAAVLPAGVDHNSLSNFVANKHIDHSAVSITAGTGLSGGGDLTATRTLSLGTVGTAGSYGSATTVPALTTDAYGRVTAVTSTAIAVPSTQVTDFAEAVDDRVAALIVAGAGVSVSYNDPSNTLTIASTLTQYTDEQAQDAVATLIQSGTGISWSYNDTLNTLTPTISLSPFTTTNLAEGTNLYFTPARAQAAISVTDTSSLDLTYSAGAISGVVLPAGVDHNSLSNFVANKHIDHSSVSISAGTGLSGGGDLTATRTLSLAASGVTASSYGTTTQVASYSVDTYGRITLSANTTIAIPSSQVTDFTEAAQDAVGGILTNTTSVSFTYNDAGNQITAGVIPAGVDHNSLSNFVANKHIDHSSVSISAGTGLSGGGDLTTTRTLSLATVGTAGTYGDATHYPVITVDAYGRVTATTSYIASAWSDAGGLLTWSDETGKDLAIRQAHAETGSPYIRQVASRGTLAVPTAVLSGDRVGGNGYYGWNSGGVDGLPCAAVCGYATEDHTPTAQGGELRVEVIPNGTTTPVTTATFTENGDLDVLGSLQLGAGTQTTDGTFRYSGGEAQVRQGGTWIVVAPVPASYNSTAVISTTSATFATMSGISVTPAAGTYLATFSCDCSINTDSNGDVALFIGASEVALARRNFGANTSGTGSTTSSGVVHFSTIITVNGAQAVTVQYRENASGTFTINARELILTPISR